MNAAHESLHTLSGAYVVDALDEQERAQFERHLPGCADCQAEVASLREAAAAMADETAMTPPSSLRDSVLAGIKTIRPFPPEVQQVPTPAETASVVVPFRRRRAFRAATFAAAAAVVAAVFTGVALNPWDDSRNPPPAAVQTPAERVMAADDAVKKTIKFEDGSKATVVRSISEGKAVLLTTDMASPPSGKVFELWLQDETGRLTPAGLMDSGGDHTILLKGDASAATGVGITVEPKGGSDQPTTEPIALVDLEKA